MLKQNATGPGRTEPIPAIDLLDGAVVRLARGDYAAVTRYGDDPVATARAWEAEGAPRLHLVDLAGARDGRPVQGALIERIVRAVGIPCQVAGGIRDADAVAAVLATGADRVVLGSALVREPALGGRLVARHGTDAIVAAIDIRDGEALGDGWIPGAQGTPALAHAARLAGEGVSLLAVTAIARDGLLEGPDLALLAEVAAAAPGARVIASAGIATLDDIRAVAAAGYAGAILGRALYAGRFTLADAIAAARG